MKDYFKIIKSEITSFDYFILFNSLLFLLMCIFVYYDRFVAYRGSGNILEFFIYASVIFAFIAVSWYKFRYLNINLPILIMIEFGILNFVLLVAVLTVLGLGTMVEIVEFIVTLTVKNNGVGAYNNNMLDLVSNFFGSTTAALIYEYALKNFLINLKLNY